MVYDKQSRKVYLAGMMLFQALVIHGYPQRLQTRLPKSSFYRLTIKHPNNFMKKFEITIYSRIL